MKFNKLYKKLILEGTNLTRKQANSLIKHIMPEIKKYIEKPKRKWDEKINLTHDHFNVYLNLEKTYYKKTENSGSIGINPNDPNDRAIFLDLYIPKTATIKDLDDIRSQIYYTLIHELQHIRQYERGKKKDDYPNLTIDSGGRILVVKDLIKYLNNLDEIESHAEEAYHKAKTAYKKDKKYSANYFVSKKIYDAVRSVILRNSPKDKINSMMDKFTPIVNKQYDYLYKKYPDSKLLMRPKPNGFVKLDLE